MIELQGYSINEIQFLISNSIYYIHMIIVCSWKTIENCSYTNCWKNTCLYHIQIIRSGKLMDLLHLQLITCIMSFFEYRHRKVYFGEVKFKTKDQKFLRTLLIFTPIPLVPKKCGLSISFYECVQRRIRECPTITYKPFHSHTKVCIFLSL